jgi:hypothetical protein
LLAAIAAPHSSEISGGQDAVCFLFKLLILYAFLIDSMLWFVWEFIPVLYVWNSGARQLY